MPIRIESCQAMRQTSTKLPRALGDGTNASISVASLACLEHVSVPPTMWSRALQYQRRTDALSGVSSGPECSHIPAGLAKAIILSERVRTRSRRGRRSRNPRSVRSRIGEKRFTKQDAAGALCKKCRKIQTSQPFSRRKLFALANILKLKNATKMHRHSGQAGDS